MYQSCRSWPLKAAVFLVTGACLLAPVASVAQQLYRDSNNSIDSIVALVDEDVILRSELDLAVAGIVDRVRASGESMPPMHLLEGQVLERLIVRELQIQRAAQTKTKRVNISLDGVSFISSGMIAAFVQANKLAKSVGVEIRFVNASPNVIEVFKITKMNKLFKIEDEAD